MDRKTQHLAERASAAKTYLNRHRRIAATRASKEAHLGTEPTAMVRVRSIDMLGCMFKNLTTATAQLEGQFYRCTHCCAVMSFSRCRILGWPQERAALSKGELVRLAASYDHHPAGAPPRPVAVRCATRFAPRALAPPGTSQPHQPTAVLCWRSFFCVASLGDFFYLDRFSGSCGFVYALCWSK